MDGVLRLLLFFGIVNAKLIKIALKTPVFVQTQSYERAAESIPVLVFGRQEQPGSSFVWPSCENAWSPVKGPE